MLKVMLKEDLEEVLSEKEDEQEIGPENDVNDKFPKEDKDLLTELKKINKTKKNTVKQVIPKLERLSPETQKKLATYFRAIIDTTSRKKAAEQLGMYDSTLKKRLARGGFQYSDFKDELPEKKKGNKYQNSDFAKIMDTDFVQSVLGKGNRCRTRKI